MGMRARNRRRRGERSRKNRSWRKDKLALGQKNYNHLGYNTRKHYKDNYYRAKYDKAQI
jgi:hypothetical protein